MEVRYVCPSELTTPRCRRPLRQAPSGQAVDGQAEEVRDNRRSLGPGHMATLTLAIILGIAGFAVALFWVASLILLGILWGAMAVEHQQQSGRGKGVLAEVVEVVVDEAKDVTGSARNGTNENRS